MAPNFPNISYISSGEISKGRFLKKENSLLTTGYNPHFYFNGVLPDIQYPVDVRGQANLEGEKRLKRYENGVLKSSKERCKTYIRPFRRF